MTQINYDSPASLNKFVSRRDALTFEDPQVWQGTLKGCVKHFLAIPCTERQFFDILVSEDAGLGKDVLDASDIEALAQRADFPKD